MLIGDRLFAVGDDVLATRNDSRIMIFNGTRATITRIDEDRKRIEAVDVHRRPLVIPFAYAEAGHLTWGYATTLHRAQGATVDQAFLLADDTLHRERSYSGLSRGAEANDVYLAVPDDEEHHGAPEVDDLIELLRQTVNRSEAKTLALQDLVSRLPATGSSIEQLRVERRRLAPIVNQAPRAPFDALAALDKDQHRAVVNLARARQEREAAEEALERLGGHRRLTKRRNRHQAEERLDRATEAENFAEATLEHIGERRKRLDAELAEWKAWTCEHGPEVGRLRELDSLIAEHRRHHRPMVEQRPVVRDVARDVGIDLGSRRRPAPRCGGAERKGSKW